MGGSTVDGVELTYPLSSGYVADWTAVRALAEFVSNALDEDPKARFTYDADRSMAIVSDRGPGLPEEALVLGHSEKGADQIGQFGEGAKLAMLVLCRELGNGSVTVHTAGISLTPRLEARGLGLGTSVKSSNLELLVVSVHPNRRRVGTTVEVSCDESTYHAVKNRFRHFGPGRYVGPGPWGEIVPGPPGRLSIGGVLVRDGLELAASYDLPLSRAKHLQNRDRTVVDGWALSSLIEDLLAYCTDRPSLERIVEAGLSGDLGRFESLIPSLAMGSEESRRAWRRAGRRVLGRGRYFWTPEGQEERELALIDQGLVRLPCRLEAQAFGRLMERIGVPTADAATTSDARVHFVARRGLELDQRRALSRVIRVARARFGPDAVDKVRVFDRGPQGCENWRGFFDPATGVIALHTRVLADEAELCSVFAHELAHRLSHLRGLEWQDRTRGFESVLSEIAGQAFRRRR